MIPLGDASRRTMRIPVVTILIITVNVAIFIMELIGGDDFILRWSLVPADIVAGRHLETILTSMFMHEGWEHIIGNMVFFWAFGRRSRTPWDPVAISSSTCWADWLPPSRRSLWTRPLPSPISAPAVPSPL